MRTTEYLLKNAVLEQILSSGLTELLQSPVPVGEITLDSEKYKAELLKVKSDVEKNLRYLVWLYESLKLGDITETEYRELKSTYETRVANFADKEITLREQIQSSTQKEKALEQARNSTLTLKSISDLTTEVIAQTIDKIIIHAKEDIEVILRDFETDTSSVKEGVDNE